ncbi:unnamed protein product [Cylicocyclus nassatus]|uniref:Uncharacterized protein n=1 Tax=Cylicocyclus nassatus TaxID=53992 RepID=A0AA36GIU5_CYLNA|nr:unnamed protein product [Cylicocyclus nassatus]
MFPEERDALADLDSRIRAMERRLQNARAARDSYLDYLKSKYPRWSCSLPVSISNMPKDTMINRLATSDYYWDERRDRQPILQRYQKPKLYQDIPNGAPFLMSDVARVRRRLAEIAHQMSIMRETRLNLTTEDYLRTRADLETFNAEEEDTMLAIRNRLSDISLTTFEPLATPTAEQMATMKYEEQRDAYIADLRAGRVLPSTVETTTTSQPLPINFQAAPTPLPVDSVKKEEVPEKIMEHTTVESKIEAHPADRRPVTSENKDEKKQANAARIESTSMKTPAALPQTTSTYSKLITLFGQQDPSDTEDDLAVPSTSVPKPIEPSVPVLPTRQQSSAGMLSQYLASSKHKEATPSDSDDDFFK